uniref:ADP ribosyltransferase domain-containing protein n=1 Tax=viral metagenome TaxID=1070528 RepID=A0A6M3LUR3_9ZZZZ
MLLSDIYDVKNGRIITKDADEPTGARWITLGKKDGEGPARRVLLDKDGKIIGGDVPKEEQGKKIESLGEENKQPSEESKIEKKQVSRGHVGGLKNEEQVIEDIQKSTNVSKELATKSYETVQFYSDGGYTDIRTGKDKQGVKILEDFIERSPKWPIDKSIYRGMNVDESFFQSLKLGKSIDMKGISSWSSEQKVAQEYTIAGWAVGGKERKKGIGIVFQLKADNATAISHISEVQHEQEVLLSGKSKILISSINKREVNGEKIWFIECREGKAVGKSVDNSYLTIDGKNENKILSLKEKWDLDSKIISIG